MTAAMDIGVTELIADINAYSHAQRFGSNVNIPINYYSRVL